MRAKIDKYAQYILTTALLIILYIFIYFSSHDIVQQFHQDYFELPEDGTPNEPKHVEARWYTNTVEPLSFGLMTSCRWLDNQKSG
jgi:hypothetical protein